jgi:hypothetical protein
MSTRTRELFAPYLDNELRMRYAPDSILPFDDNQIVHRFFKNHYTSEEAAEFKVMNDNIIRMSYVLAKHLQQEPVVNTISFETPLTQHLLDELNLRPTKEDFQKIREKELQMCIVGNGGAMMNMLFNMYLWSMELSETRVFKKIVVFEKDSLDFTNMMRMGKPMAFNYVSDYIKQDAADAPLLNTLKKNDMLTIERELSSERRILNFVSWLDDPRTVDLIANKGYFFVGAPTLETRELLQDKKFFFLGHSDFEVDITYRPQLVSTLSVETYGSIDIPVLLINLQLATAAFIKILASDDEYQPDQRLLNFDMKTWVDNNQEKLKELYND